MNYKTLLSRLFVSGALVVPMMLTPIVAEAAEPAETTTPNRVQSPATVKWEPLGRVNAAKAVTVVLENTTQEQLEYLITTHTNFRNLAPGSTTRLVVEPAALPVFLNVNTTSTTNLRYSLKVDNNTVMVKLEATRGPGDRTLNIQETGGIFVY